MLLTSRMLVAPRVRARTYRVSAEAYSERREAALRAPVAFWLDAARSIEWVVAPTVAVDRSRAPLFQWFPDGVLNTCHNAIDRHLDLRAEQRAVAFHSAVGGDSESSRVLAHTRRNHGRDAACRYPTT